MTRAWRCFQSALMALALGPRPGVLQLGVEVAAEHDVGTAAGHVGGDGDGAGLAGAGDDAGLALVLLGVQHLVGIFSS
jgi:hypothetical protein